MEQILQGGAELILGGSTPLSTISVAVTVIASILLVVLFIYMHKNPPSSLFGQIAFIIGIVAVIGLSFFIGMRGAGMFLKSFV